MNFRLLLLLVIIIFFFGCKKKSIIEEILKREYKNGHDTVNLSSILPFDWDIMIESGSPELISNEIGYVYPYMEDVDELGYGGGKSILFLKDNKIIYHEDEKYKYSGFDIVGGGLGFCVDTLFPLFKTTSKHAIFKLTFEESNGGKIFLLHPLNFEKIKENSEKE